MTSYEKFLKYCNIAGKSPSKVAVEAGSSRSMVSSWKIGRTRPTDATLAKLAEYFNVPVTALMDDADTQSQTIERETPVPMNERQAYWAERINALSPPDQVLVGAVLDGFRDNPEAMRAALGLALRAAMPSVPVP